MSCWSLFVVLWVMLFIFLIVYCMLSLVGNCRRWRTCIRYWWFMVRFSIVVAEVLGLFLKIWIVWWFVYGLCSRMLSSWFFFVW